MERFVAELARALHRVLYENNPSIGERQNAAESIVPILTVALEICRGYTTATNGMLHQPGPMVTVTQLIGVLRSKANLTRLSQGGGGVQVPVLRAGDLTQLRAGETPETQFEEILQRLMRVENRLNLNDTRLTTVEENQRRHQNAIDTVVLRLNQTKDVLANL